MKEKLRFLGLDVHAETIAVAIAEWDGEVRSLGTIPNRADSLRKLIRKLGPAEKLRVCYEAGPTGYVVYWQLAELGVKCEVVAPTLVPVKAGDRVKTDRRDAEKLARSYRSGDLTAVWVPDEGSRIAPAPRNGSCWRNVFWWTMTDTGRGFHRCRTPSTRIMEWVCFS
jgi:transposase